jgi:DNA-binding FadR family transcriptional regulator
MAENTQSNKVYEYILQQIKDSIWETGDRIYSEKELCEKLSVSRIAVRAALDKLSALGILEKRKGSGSYVSEIDLRSIVGNIVPLMALKAMDIVDVLSFRLYFEQGNVIEFMRNHDEGDVEALKNTYRIMQDNMDDHDVFDSADFDFHRIIAKGTHNPIVISINDMLTGIIKASLKLTYVNIGPEMGLRFHKRIIEAIEQKDSEMATLFMRRHIEDCTECIKEKLGKLDGSSRDLERKNDCEP